MIVSSVGPDGYRSVERKFRPAKLVRNGGFIDVHVNGKWVAGFLPGVLARALALEEDGAVVECLAECDGEIGK